MGERPRAAGVVVVVEALLDEHGHVIRPETRKPSQSHDAQLAASHEPGHGTWRHLEPACYLLTGQKRPARGVTFLVVTVHDMSVRAYGAPKSVDNELRAMLRLLAKLGPVDRRQVSPAVRSEEARVHAAHALGSAFAAEDHFETDFFQRKLEAVRQDDPDAAAREARDYTLYRGRGREAVAAMLRIAAAEADPRSRREALMNAGGRAVWTDAPLQAGDPCRRRADYRAAADKVVRFGMRRCLVCGTSLASDANGGRGRRGARYYCRPHGASRARLRDFERDAMQRLLVRAHESLGP